MDSSILSKEASNYFLLGVLYSDFLLFGVQGQCSGLDLSKLTFSPRIGEVSSR